MHPEERENPESLAPLARLAYAGQPLWTSRRELFRSERLALWWPWLQSAEKLNWALVVISMIAIPGWLVLIGLMPDDPNSEAFVPWSFAWLFAMYGIPMLVHRVVRFVLDGMKSDPQFRFVEMQDTHSYWLAQAYRDFVEQSPTLQWTKELERIIGNWLEFRWGMDLEQVSNLTLAPATRRSLFSQAAVHFERLELPMTQQFVQRCQQELDRLSDVVRAEYQEKVGAIEARKDELSVELQVARDGLVAEEANVRPLYRLHWSDRSVSA